MKVLPLHSIVLIAFLALLMRPAPAGAQDQEWGEMAPMPEPRYGMAAVALDGSIYVIGGWGRGPTPLSSVLRYDVDASTWHDDVAPLDDPRVEPAAVVLGGKIYVIGGADDEEEAEDDVEVYDPVSNTWEDVQDLRHERSGHNAVVVGDRIYVVGGRDDDGRLVEEIEYYDAEEDEWEISADWRLSQPRVSFALVVVDDTVYAFGGFGATGPLPEAERFAVGGGVGVFLPPGLAGGGPGFLRGRLAATSTGSGAFLLGGRAVPDRVVSDVTLFTPSAERMSDRWTRMPSMHTPRERFAAASVDGQLYAIGGRNESTILSTAEVLHTGTNVGDEPVVDLPPFRLEQNHPNPFTNSTTIPFVVESDRPEPVSLSVYDLQGRLVATLADGYFPPGRHEVTWTGSRADGSRIASGVFVYTLQHGDRRQSRILTRIR